MRTSLISLAAVFAACGSQVDERDTAGTTSTTTTAISPAPAPVAAERPVILAELFTSQGCSSCPPADRLLSSIDELAAGGAEVIPLAFHVDYWDDLGWKDPFSTAAWTDRQRRYAARVSGGRVYTPMLVVQGRAHMVGSSPGEVADALRRASRAPGDGAAIDGRAAGPARVATDAAAGASRAAAFLVLVESGIETEVTRGENQGRVLRNDFIVRRLARAFDLAPRERKSETVELAIDPAWRRDRLAVVLFLQDPESLAIRAAARATLGP
ncbi:MAG TPA: DUF1223 domain-containing protein [Kofleriaceae bacterium]|nr:DUF1223 domain-containing protein [Kofleriaceae bacterium]